MRPIVCACGNTLGVRLSDGRVRMQHRGRWSVGPCPDEIGCERCGAVWTPDTEKGRQLVPALAGVG